MRYGGTGDWSQTLQRPERRSYTMQGLTPSNRLDTPLRKIRMILGDAKGPLHQQEFAALVGTPVATLRATERGSRSMTA
jgi:DNA-binding transcriptional regulator YiaG